jgi:hypothetical protein
MDRYFRSNDDLSVPPPLSSVGGGSGGVNSGVMPSSPPNLSTLETVQQHLQQGQGIDLSSPGMPVSASSRLSAGSGTRRQVSSSPSGLR